MASNIYKINQKTTSFDKTIGQFKFKISVQNYVYAQTYNIKKLNTYHILPSAQSAFTSYDNFLYMLKKHKIKRLLVDIKNYNPNIFKRNLVDKNLYEDIIIFENQYKSTNRSDMTLVMIDLSKIKLNQIKQ